MLNCLNSESSKSLDILNSKNIKTLSVEQFHVLMFYVFLMFCERLWGLRHNIDSKTIQSLEVLMLKFNTT